MVTEAPPDVGVNVTPHVPFEILQVGPENRPDPLADHVTTPVGDEPVTVASHLIREPTTADEGTQLTTVVLGTTTIVVVVVVMVVVEDEVVGDIVLVTVVVDEEPVLVVEFVAVTVVVTVVVELVELAVELLVAVTVVVEVEVVDAAVVVFELSVVVMVVVEFVLVRDEVEADVVVVDIAVHSAVSLIGASMIAEAEWSGPVYPPGDPSQAVKTKVPTVVGLTSKDAFDPLSYQPPPRAVP